MGLREFKENRDWRGSSSVEMGSRKYRQTVEMESEWRGG